MFNINNQIPQSIPENRGMMETQNTEVSLPDTNNLSVQNFSVSDDLIKNLHNSPEVGT